MAKKSYVMSIAMAILLIGNVAVGTIITVNGDGTADYTTIQDAIDASSNGDEIIVSPGTYTNVGSWVFNPNGKSIWIHSSAGADSTIIDGQAARKGARLTSDETTTTIIEGFTFTNCVVGMYCTASPVIRGCIFSGNTNPGGSGAGIYTYGHPVIDDCYFVGNSSNNAAAIYISAITSSSPTIIDCTFSSNSALSYGGAIRISHASPTFTDCNFLGNTAAIAGGAVQVGSDSTPTFTNCDFTKNSAGQGGGFTMSNAGSTATMTNCTFLYNSSTEPAGAFSGGGAIYNQYANIVLNGCHISHSTGYRGGAIHSYQATGTLTDCVFKENTADQGGGAICNLNSTYDLLNCTFESNLNTCELCGGGGAIANYDSTVSMNSCVMNNNSAYRGGALYNLAGTVALIGCSITNNIAQHQGGGTYSSVSFVTVEECDSSGNIAKGVGGGSEGPGNGVYLSSSSRYEYIGANTSDEILVRNIVNYGSDLQFNTDATCNVTGNVSTSTGGTAYFDINSLTADEQLHVNGDLVRRGAMGVTNATGSLSAAAVGNIIPLAQATTMSGGFSSVTFPMMPSGLGLQLIEQDVARTLDTEVAVKVIEVEEATFSSPFTGDLDSSPLDIESFNADGVGGDEIVVLFEGTPGGIACFSISSESAPVLITGFSATVGNDPVDLDVGDLNGDGFEDVIVANGTSNTVSVFTTFVGTDGSLSFNPEVVLSLSDASTCIAIMDWDDDTSLDAVVGIDIADNNLTDGYQVLLDVSSDSSNGPWFTVEKEIINNELLPNLPTCVDGGEQTGAWGFVGGSQYGVVHRAVATSALQNVAELGSNSNTNTIEALHLDDNTQIDLMVASDNAEMIYLFKGNATEADEYDDVIPVAVSEPVEDIVALDADFDGDTDIVMLSPSSDTPLVLLRNDGNATGFIQSLAGTVWSKQPAGSGGETMTKVAGGELDGKDEDDDWLTSVGGSDEDGLFRDAPLGTIEQTSVVTETQGCNGDMNNDDLVNIHDLLILIGAWGASNSIADLNADDVVNIHDLLILVGAWGSCD